MIDIHSHILPGIDDGSPDMEESIEMARIAVYSGVTQMVATPHFNLPWDKRYTLKELEERLLKLQEQLKKEKISLEIVVGMEVYGGKNLERLLGEKQLMPLNRTQYILIEFNFEESELVLAQRLAMVKQYGYTPIIAHPERYRCVQRNPQFIYECIKKGYCVQINKGSILGRFGKSANRAAMALLDHGLVTCVASDAHMASMRTPYLRDAYEEVCEGFGMDYANMVFLDNPKLMLEGKKPRTLQPLSFF